MTACQLFGNLGRKISSSSGDDREGAFLFQRVSVLVQRFNTVLLHDSLPTPELAHLEASRLNVRPMAIGRMPPVFLFNAKRRPPRKKPE